MRRITSKILLLYVFPINVSSSIILNFLGPPIPTRYHLWLKRIQLKRTISSVDKKDKNNMSCGSGTQSRNVRPGYFSFVSSLIYHKKPLSVFNRTLKITHLSFLILPSVQITFIKDYNSVRAKDLI